jgi:hypothetical protein
MAGTGLMTAPLILNARRARARPANEDVDYHALADGKVVGRIYEHSSIRVCRQAGLDEVAV